ncbi:MAG: tetratricopeptide repeat protein [Candidatus Abyssubacteria bacterium]|nr:tetratricopeptide repeat protein [Candidatus Abyssubacteria bacterium]
MKSALGNYAWAITYYPGNADPIIRMGGIYFRQGRYEQSAEQYRVALNFKPDSPRLHRQLAKIYTIQGDRDRAETHIRKLQELNLMEEPSE